MFDTAFMFVIARRPGLCPADEAILSWLEIAASPSDALELLAMTEIYIFTKFTLNAFKITATSNSSCSRAP